LLQVTVNSDSEDEGEDAFYVIVVNGEVTDLN
jgi:hypothetical protein